jgi:hypothetical protein
LERLGALGEETMANALNGVGGESVERMVSELAVVKENLRRLIHQRDTTPTGERRYG